MSNNELKGKMVMVPRTAFGREHVAYCMHVDKDYIYCIDWNGNRDSLSVNTQGFREAYPFSNPDGTPDYRQPMLDYRMFSYDPAQSRDPINQLKAWLQSLFQAQGLGQRDIVERIKSMVVPCSQSFMTMNPIITQLETYVLTPWLRFSNSPLWPWQAGNAMMVTSRDDTLKKIIKSKPQNKVDNLHVLLDAIYGYEMSEGNISQE